MRFWVVVLVLASMASAKFTDSCRVVKFSHVDSLGNYTASNDTQKVVAEFYAGKELNWKTKLFDKRPCADYVIFHIAGNEILVKIDQHLVTLGEIFRSDLRGFDEVSAHDTAGNKWLILPLKPTTFIDPN